MIGLQIISLFAFSIFVVKILENYRIKYAAIFLLSLLMLLQIISYATYHQLFNSNMMGLINFFDITSTIRYFWPWYLLAVIFFIIYFAFLCFSSKFRILTHLYAKSKIYSICICALLVCFLSVSNGIFRLLANTVSQVTAGIGSYTLEGAFSNLGFDINDYTTIEELKSTTKGRKNIVVISLESLDNLFLGRKDLTPSLNRLAEEWTYFSRFSSQGIFDTLQALYAWSTGNPPFFGVNIELAFDKSKPEHLVSLPAILKKSGYNLSFVANDPSFSATDTLVKNLGYDTVRGYFNDYSDLRFDQDTFELAKKEFSRLVGLHTPFMLTVSTLDTHFPWIMNTEDDPRRPRTENISKEEQLVQWTDSLTADFIEYMRSSGELDNTLVFIMPDHLSRSIAVTPAETEQERSLYLITNAPLDTFSISRDKWINHYDIPNMILEAAEIESNATFFRFLAAKAGHTGELFNKWIEENVNNIIALNKAFWTRADRRVMISDKIDGYTIKIDEYERLVQCAPDEVVIFNVVEYFRSRNQIEKLLVVGKEKAYQEMQKVFPHQDNRIFPAMISPENNKYSVTLLPYSPFAQTLYPDAANSVTIDINALMDSEKQRLHLSKANPFTDFHKNHDVFIAHAGGTVDGISMTNSREALTEAVMNGFRFIELDLLETSDEHFIAAHDWGHFNKITGHPELGNTRLPLAEAMGRKIHGKFTPLSGTDIKAFLRGNKYIFLVTDKANNFKLLASEIGHTNRMIVETFSLENYRQLMNGAYGWFGSAALCVTNIDALKKARDAGVQRITAPSNFMESNPSEFKKLYNSSVDIMIYGARESEEYFAKYIGKTMSMYYTDSWSVTRGQIK